MKKKTRFVGVRMTPELYSLIIAEAKSRNLPVSWWLRSLLNQYLKKDGMENVKLP